MNQPRGQAAQAAQARAVIEVADDRQGAGRAQRRHALGRGGQRQDAKAPVCACDNAQADVAAAHDHEARPTERPAPALHSRRGRCRFHGCECMGLP